MTARNLGVVFGRMYHPCCQALPLCTHAPTAAATLMRSRNPAAEFSDMAGKALTIEWLVENAPTIFPPLPSSCRTDHLSLSPRKVFLTSFWIF